MAVSLGLAADSSSIAGRGQAPAGPGRPPKTAGAAAAQWYRLSADQGNIAAQNNLGSLYEKGQGVPQDLVQSVVWYSLAAAQGNPNAARNRDIILKRLTPEQAADAEKRAKAWQPA